MYTIEEINKIKLQIRNSVLFLISLFILSLSLSILIAFQMSDTLGLVFMSVAMCICVFYWGLFGSPVVNYYYFLREITTGRSRNLIGRVKIVSEKPVYKDIKLFFYEVIVEEKGEDRLLLIDANAAFPEIKENQNYEFKVHENYVIELSFS